jgi:hypothetical protein
MYPLTRAPLCVCSEAISEDFDILIDCAAPDNPSFLTGGDDESSGRYKVQKLTDLDLKEGSEGGGGDAAVGARELSDDNVQTLQASCEVVDALGPTVRKSVIKAFNRKQLKPYGILFRRGSGADLGDGLEGVERRYMWARRALRDIDAKYKRVLPPHWHVLHRLALDFAEATRNDIDRILGQYDPPSSAPADALLRALMKTLAWEKEMAKLFEKAAAADGGAAGGSSKSGRDAGIGAAMFDDGSGGADGEAYDESAPLYNSKGEAVDPTSAEGIRLKYKRKKEWEERRANEAHRKAERDQKRAWWASLAGMDGGGGGAAASKRDDEYASLPRFAEPGRGIISSAFEPYMGAYVRFERAQVDGVVASATAEELAAGPAGAVGGAGTGASASSTGVGGAPILRSSTQLFFQARNSMARCSELNKGATLFSLFKEVKEAFGLYAAGLEARLPKPLSPAPGALPGDTYDVPLDDLTKAVNLVDSLCLVVNTAEYCADTLPALGDNVRRLLDDSFKPHVGTLEDAQEVFFSLQAAALKTLVRAGGGGGLWMTPLIVFSTSASAARRLTAPSPYPRPPFPPPPLPRSRAWWRACWTRRCRGCPSTRGRASPRWATSRRTSQTWAAACASSCRACAPGWARRPSATSATSLRGRSWRATRRRCSGASASATRARSSCCWTLRPSARCCWRRRARARRRCPWAARAAPAPRVRTTSWRR